MMKRKSIENIFKEAADKHSSPTPSGVWDRIEQELPSSQARMRSLRPQKASRFPAIAASLLAFLVATWWLLSGIESTKDTLPLVNATTSEEGSLEIVNQPKPVFSDAVYEGIRVKDGAPGVKGELRACVRC